MEADRFGAALIGSAHSLGYLEAIRESDNCNFVGVAERHPDRLESAQANPRWAAVRWASVNEILSDDSIEVVCVETDPLESLAFSLHCVRAGIRTRRSTSRRARPKSRAHETRFRLGGRLEDNRRSNCCLSPGMQDLPTVVERAVWGSEMPDLTPGNLRLWGDHAGATRGTAHALCGRRLNACKQAKGPLCPEAPEVFLGQELDSIKGATATMGTVLRRTGQSRSARLGNFQVLLYRVFRHRPCCKDSRKTL